MKERLNTQSCGQCIRETCTTTKGVQDLLSSFDAKQVLEEVSRFIPVVGPMLAVSISFACTYKCLDYCLKTMKKTEINVMKNELNIPGTN